MTFPWSQHSKHIELKRLPPQVQPKVGLGAAK